MIGPNSMMVSRLGMRLARNRCGCCGDDLDAHQAVSTGICGKDRCKGWKIEQVGAELLQRRRREALERMVERTAPSVAAAAAAIGADPGSVARAAVRWQAGAPGPLPDPRRTAFEEHLRWIAGLAFQAPLPKEGPLSRKRDERAGIEADEPPVLAAACALCRGKCCNQGADTAMLSEDDVVRWRKRRAHGTTDEFVAEYVAALPAESVARSCVYLAAAGCALPRGMRNDWCNASQCGERRNLEATLEESGAEMIVIIATDDTTETVGAVAGWSATTGAVEVPLVLTPDDADPAAAAEDRPA